MLAKSRAQSDKRHINQYTMIDRFMLVYEQAHLAWYGHPCRLSYRRGWYYLNGVRLRHSQLKKLTENLLALLQEEACPTPEQTEQEEEIA